ncbi:MAG: transposase [Planctomycetota bacterium]
MPRLSCGHDPGVPRHPQRLRILAAQRPATKVNTRSSLAQVAHNAAERRAAKAALKHPPVRFTGPQAKAIAHGFTIAAAERDYAIRALAILPDHAHLVIERHPRPIVEIARHLKAKATQRLSAEGLHPLAKRVVMGGCIPSPWARNQWVVYIDTPEHIETAVRYVEQNPVKAGLPRQQWSVVEMGRRGKPRR